MFSKKYLLRVMMAAVCFVPAVAMAASWDATLLEYGRNVRLGLYAIGGSMALITLLWSGIRWLMSRASGDHSHTFMDYLQQVGVIMVVGGALVLAAGAWQVFGTGNPT
jgi:hypothetical protein